MRYVLPVLVAAVALAIDPGVYRSFHTPKNYIFLALVPLAWTALLVWKWTRRQESKLVITWLEGVLIVRFAWVAATNPALAWHPSDLGFWILFALTALAVLSRQLAGSKRQNILTAFLRSLWILGAILAIIGLWQYSSTEFLPPDVKTFMVGTIGSANGYGSFLALALAAGTADLFVVGQKGYLRLSVSASMMLMAAALILNGSRGALFGLVVAGAILFLGYCLRSYYLGRMSNRWLQTKKQVASIAMVLVLAVGSIGWGLYKLNPESAAGRFMMWDITLPMIAEHPAFGLGQGRYADEYLIYQANYFSQSENDAWRHKAANIKQAHNEYLQAFAESGIPGGLLFLAVWGLALLQLLKRLVICSKLKWADWSLAGVLLVVLVHALVDAPLHVLPVAVAAYVTLGFVPLGKKRIIRSSKTFVIVGLILFTSLFSGFALYKTMTEYSGYYSWKVGIDYADRHQWEWAIQSYEQALGRLSGKGELQFHLGAALSINGNYAHGTYYLEKALETFSDRNLYLAMSYAQLRLANYDVAQHYALLSHHMFPDHLTPHLLLGQIYFRQKRFTKSKAALQKCIRRDTHVQSPAVAQIARDARRLWEQYYGHE